MAETRRDVEIQLKARDAYSGEFEKLNARIKALAGEITQPFTEASRSIGNLFKAVAAGGAVSGGLTVLTALTKGFRGDAEGAAEALGRLPFGIGRIVGDVRALKEAFTGMERFNESLESAVKHSEAMRAAMEASAAASAKARESVRDITIATQDRIALLKAQGEFDREHIAILAQGRALEEKARQASAEVFARFKETTESVRDRVNALKEEREVLRSELDKTPSPATVGLNMEIRRRIREIDMEIKAQERLAVVEGGRFEMSRRALVEEKALLQEEIRLRLIDLATREGAAAQREREVIKEAREKIAKQAQEAIRAEMDRLSRIRSVEFEIEQIRLRAQGKVFEAEKLAIEQSIRLRIEAARKAGDAELEAKLKVLQVEQMAALAARHSATSTRPGGVQPLETRFLTRAPESAFSEANSAEARRVEALRMEVQRLREVSEESKETLKRIERDRTIIRVENN